jgi:hypothetical protein
MKIPFLHQPGPSHAIHLKNVVEFATHIPTGLLNSNDQKTNEQLMQHRPKDMSTGIKMQDKLFE